MLVVLSYTKKSPVVRRISVEESSFFLHLDVSVPGELSKAVAYCLVPLEEGWEEVRYFAEAVVDPTGAVRQPEWVYVLVNRMFPGVCKVGMTTTSVSQRVDEINSATGVIVPWYPVFKYKCVNSRELEKRVHQELDRRGYRVNEKREGFLVSSSEVVQVIKELGEFFI